MKPVIGAATAIWGVGDERQGKSIESIRNCGLQPKKGALFSTFTLNLDVNSNALAL